ncbi:MAG: hypothetical protein NTU78_10160 [Alphaproteobacteria bacterium]|nr:hypothetical protein [Alphaproteobacteria bacterium]
MFGRSVLLVLAALFSGVMAAAAVAETGTAQLMREHLRSGQLEELRKDLADRLEQAPADDELRFGLGATQFLIAIEHMSQFMYRHGLEQPRGLQGAVPFLRFPLPLNPAPEPLTYEKTRGFFMASLSDLAAAQVTLAGMGSGDVKLPVAIGLVRLDLDGDGTASEEETLWRVFDSTLGGGNITAQDAEAFVVVLDRGDAAWLRGYTHLLSALLEFPLAHDWQQGFDASFHMFFPRAGLPNAILDATPSNLFGDPSAASFADLIAFIHLMHWPVTEPKRMEAVLGHLESVVALSRESWKFILAETDDEAEWIPNPRQTKSVLPGVPVTQETVDGWLLFLGEFDALLTGRKLIPHWRLEKGINLRRVFAEPRTFDPVLWMQGSAALPYLEDGELTSSDTWSRIMGLLQGNFLGYAIWFN